jgi:hypothetical protein
MRFDVYQGEKIEVSSPDYTLYGQFQGSIKHHVKLFEGEKLILEWSLPTILLFRKVTIRFQDLPIPIYDVKHRGLWSLVVVFGDNEIVVKQRPFRKAFFQIHLNGNKVADVYYPKKFMAGYTRYIIETNTENYEDNLNCIVAFLLHLRPLTS